MDTAEDDRLRGLRMDIWNRLRDLRELADLSQEAIADHIGLDTSHISNVERDRKGMPLAKVMKWADRLDARLVVAPRSVAVPGELAALPADILDIVLRLARVIRALPDGEREMLADQIDSAGRRHVPGYEPRHPRHGQDRESDHDEAIVRATTGLIGR